MRSITTRYRTQEHPRRQQKTGLTLLLAPTEFPTRCGRTAHHLLVKIYNVCMRNVCMRNVRIPSQCQLKLSSTILIYKKGNKTNPSNWRSISLQTRTDRMEDSKRRNKNATIVWIDLKNAFGSVPHDTTWKMVERLGVPADVHEICRDICHNAAHTVRSTAGNTRGARDLQLCVYLRVVSLPPYIGHIVLPRSTSDSWTVRAEFEPRNHTLYRFKCGDCARVFPTRRSASNHHSQAHGKPSRPTVETPKGTLLVSSVRRSSQARDRSVSTPATSIWRKQAPNVQKQTRVPYVSTVIGQHTNTCASSRH